VGIHKYKKEECTHTIFLFLYLNLYEERRKSGVNSIYRELDEERDQKNNIGFLFFFVAHTIYCSIFYV
jgi:hypothetical protein